MTTLAGSTDTLTRDALAVLQPSFLGTEPPDWVLRRLDEGLTGVGLFGRNIENPEQVARLTARLRAARPDVLVAMDEEGGDVTRLEVRTGSSFPGNLALGAVDDPGLTRAVARELGRRLAAVGVNLDWAPSADVNSNPDNPVIGARSFGAEPALVARHTAAYIEGLQDAGVSACAKHFPGHGDTNVDSHHAMPRIDVPVEVLRERELVPFRAAIAAGTKAVMSAHILLPALRTDVPATVSPAVLTGLLRAPVADGGLGFTGLIITDALEMQAIAATYGIEGGAVRAVAAGADAMCIGARGDEEIVLRTRDALVAAVRSGDLPEERLADAAARVRALAAWSASAPAAAASGAVEGIAPDPGVGQAAARRALRVTGAEGYEPPTGPVYVAGFTPVASIAVGQETPWGVGAELERELPGTESAVFDGSALGAGDGGSGDPASREGLSALTANVLAAARDRRIVAVVRDVHRHPWMADALDALLAARPDTVVVEMGVPQAPPRGAPHIATHGAARVCGRAAAEVITGKGAGA